MKFPMGEIIRGEIWEIQIINFQQQLLQVHNNSNINFNCNISILYHTVVI